jgi:enoyl-CoA hydratase/carnithine racemase
VTGSIQTDLVDGVLTVTLSQPERLNACTHGMARDLIAAVDRADADDDVGAVVFTGAGSAFCAGADLSGGGPEVFSATRDIGGELTLRLFAARKPLIAAVNGLAVGAGMTMILPMDIRLAAEGARFGLPFGRRGIVPDACSSWFLPRIVGINRAAEWCYSGRLFAHDEALASGLVQEVVPAGELLERASVIGREIATSSSPVSIALTRALLWQMLGARHPMEAHRVESALIPWLAEHGDAPEAMAAFLEKRPAQFQKRVSQDLPPSYPWWEDPPFSD